MSEANQQTAQPLGDAQTNSRPGSEVSVSIDPEPLVFYRPETNEIIVVEKKDANRFLSEVRTLDQLMHASIQAKEACLKASDELLHAQRESEGPDRTTPQHPKRLAQAEQNMSAANKRLEEAQHALAEEFKPLGTLDGTGGKLHELIPVKTRSTPNAAAANSAGREGHTWARKWTYVRSDKVRNHFRSYALNTAEQGKYQSNQSKSIIDTDGKIDTQELKRQLTELKASATWKEEVLAQGTFADELNESMDASLTEWAEGISNSSQHINLEPECQLLRYFAGAGAQTDWDPHKGNIAVRANARAEFAIAEAKFSGACYWPGRAGFMLEFTGPKSGKKYQVGLVRGALILQLSGIAGASASAQLGVAVDYTDIAAGKTGMRGNPAKKAMGRKALDISKKVRDEAELGGAADIFAGARATGQVAGSFDWNNPEEKAFTALCKIGPGGEVQAGIGASATFKIIFSGGKFRILMAASACLGVGAAGQLAFDVAINDTLQFSEYVAHMLYSVGYEFTELFLDDTYERLTALTVWAITSGESLAEALEDVGEDLGRIYAELMRDFEKEEMRIDLMNKVLTGPKELEYATPEAKGMLLYQLTRHDYHSIPGALSIPANTGASDLTPWQLEFVGKRKRAVVAVCKKARSKPEFRNMMQHLTQDGSKDPEGWEPNFEHVKRFLDMKADMQDLDTEVQEYYDELPIKTGDDLVALYERLYDNPIQGYAFVNNTTALYARRKYEGAHSGFMIAGGFDPGPLVPRTPHGNTAQSYYV